MLPETRAESLPGKRPNLAGVAVTIAPSNGVELPGLRAALVKTLVKAGTRVRDFDGATRVMAGYRLGPAASPTDLYGHLVDVMRVAPSSVGGVVLWPETMRSHRRTVDAGGESFYPPEAVTTWRSAFVTYEGERAARLAKLEAELERYKREFDAAWRDYVTRRGLLQEIDDDKDGPSERRQYQRTLSEASSAREALQNAVVASTLPAAAASNGPRTIELVGAQVRISVFDARSGEVVGIHEVEAEATTESELTTRIADAAARALGVKR